MKTYRLLAVFLLTAFALAGCYVVIDEGVGSVGIELPESNQTGESTYDFARIYLLNGIAMVDISDTETPEMYKQVENAEENEVTIGPVPSGPGYQVIIALGNDVAAGDDTVFVPGKYAVSEEFAVVAGQATPIDLETGVTDFQYVTSLLGMNLVDVKLVGTSLYTAATEETGSTFYELDETLTITDTEVLPAGELANSIGLGAYVEGTTTAVPNVPWINTTKGIIPYYNNALDLTWDDDISDPVNKPLPSILDSGAFIADNDLFGWFQRDGGLGGVYDEFLASTAKQWLEDIDLSTFVNGEPVSDLAVDFSGGTVEGYFASKLGAFKLPEEVLTDPEIDTVPEILDAATFFEVVIDEEDALITELALVGGTDSLYLGTNRGVLSVLKSQLALDEIPVSDSDVVTESLGRVVQEMAIGQTYQAILTDHFLIVSANAGSTYSVVPIYAGIVTEPTGLFLDDLEGVVLISGETGMALLDIDDV